MTRVYQLELSIDRLVPASLGLPVFPLQRASSDGVAADAVNGVSSIKTAAVNALIRITAIVPLRAVIF
jgi:hypothetical protein